ncbi:MAG: CBS domain-containing protein [Desulfovibrionaceae bacterium]|nr:CBS domain-containing protein [Desulfovibrionaceae bacterium]
MLVQDWMKTNVVTVTPDTTLHVARRLFQENNIHSLPVINDNKRVVGLFTTTELKRYAPTNTTGVEILEALELLDITKVKEAMVPNPPTIHPHNTIEQAAQHMIDKHVVCLPVTDTAGILVGILSGSNVFKALLDLSGADQPGIEAGFILQNKPGELLSIIEKLRSLGMRMIAVLSSLHGEGSDTRKVKLRFRGANEELQDKAVEMLRSHPGLKYWMRGDEFFLCEDYGKDKK